MENLVEEIQDLSLDIETLNRKIMCLHKARENNNNSLRMHENAIEEHIKRVSH